MDKLVDSVSSAIEFLSQGAFAALLVWYAVSLYHPLSSIVVRYIRTVWGRLFRFGARYHIAIGLLLAGLYIWGVFSNAFNYWCLHPVQTEIIDRVRHSEPVFGDPQGGDVVYLFTRIVERTANEPDYSAYIRDDAYWRNTNLRAHDSIFPDLRRFIRILRGIVVSGYVVLAIALTKVFIACVALIAVGVRPGSKFANWLYTYFVSLDAYDAREENPRVAPTAEGVLTDLLVPNIWFLLFGILILLAGVEAYKTAERELQLLIMHGAGTAVR